MEDSHNIEVSWRRQLIISLIISLLWIANIFGNLPEIMVINNISTGAIVCPGSIIIFTCTTRGSAIISWTGNDYVGDQIGFNTANMIGETRQGSVDPNTIATLINNTVDNTTPILVSQLRITVSIISLNQSVICVHNSNGIRETATFQVIGFKNNCACPDYINYVDPSRPRATAHLTGDPMRGCTLHISWIIPDNTAISDISHFMIYVDGMNVHNQTNPNGETFSSLSYFVRSCGPHNTSISIVNRCGQVGPPSLTVSTIGSEPVVCNDVLCEENTAPASNRLTTVFEILFGISMGFVVTLIVPFIILVFCLIKIKKRAPIKPALNPDDE